MSLENGAGARKWRYSHGDMQSVGAKACVERLLAEGQAAWPTIAIEASAFGLWLAERAFDAEGLAALRAADLYLAFACAQGNNEAVRTFEQRYFDDVAAVLGSMNLTVAPDEVRQLLRVKLFSAPDGKKPLINEYAGRGDLRAWFRVIVVRTALNLRRATKREIPIPEGFDHTLALATADPELAYLRERYRPDFGVAFHEAISALTPEERTLLRYRYVDGLTVETIGSIYGIHKVTAARRLERARGVLIEKIRLLLRERLHVTTSELDSLLKLVETSVEMDLAELLPRAMGG